MNRWKLIPVATLMLLLSVVILMRASSSHSQDVPSALVPTSASPVVEESPFEGLGGNDVPVPAIAVPVPGAPGTPGANTPADLKSADAATQMRVVRLQHASAESVHQIVKTLFATTVAMVAVDPRTNSLIVRAPDSLTAEILQLVQELDDVKTEPNLAPGGAMPPGAAGMVYSGLARGRLGIPLPPSASDVVSTAELKQQYDVAERDAYELTRVIHREGTGAARQAELRQRVQAAFVARQRLLRAELKDLERRIATTQNAIDLRDRVADQIVDRRTSDLLNPNLQWDFRSEGQPGTEGSGSQLTPPPRSTSGSGPPGMPPGFEVVPAPTTPSRYPVTKPVPHGGFPGGYGPSPGLTPAVPSAVPATPPVKSSPTLILPAVPKDSPKPAGAALKPESFGWKSFRHDLHQSGVASSTLPDKLELLWEVPLGDQIVASAAIVGEQVFVPCLSGELVCLQRTTGKRLWTYTSDAGFKSVPTVEGDSIFLGDEAGVFHAIDMQTGKGRWMFPTEGEIYSSAAVVDGRVIFGSYDKFLYCLHERDGTLVWKYATNGYVHCAPAVVDGVVFIAGCDEHVRAIDIETGKQKFEIPLQTYLIASPAIIGDMLYVGTYANEVVALDWKSKAVTWRYGAGEGEHPFHSSAAVTDQLVVVGGRDKLVHAIDRSTGQKAWTFPTRAKIDSSPAIVGERVFIGSEDGNLYELGLANGKERWKFNAGKAISAGPAIGEGVLVVGSESRDGRVYCFGEKAISHKP